MWEAFVHRRAERCRQAGHVVVAGVVNVQQTVPVDGFPLTYAPVRYATGRLRLAASGVGLNVAHTLGALGTPVSLTTLVGDDPAGMVIRAELRRLGLLGEDADDAYSRPWLAAASVVFCSAERLTASPADTAVALLSRSPAQTVLIGMGGDGCLLATRDRPPRHLPARAPHGVLDTTGAGDALCAGFLHYWLATGDPDAAARHAVVVAGCAVGSARTDVHVTAAHIDDLLRAPDAWPSGSE